MVTFTEAAAAEMRHRLRVRLAEVVAQAPKERSEWWPRTVGPAGYGTNLHAAWFLSAAVRENFHLLGIDPPSGFSTTSNATAD